ncbi:hypothetical protein KFL_004700090 [Klebsormidium nitens]|uniref:Probable magnesium transporter n=1 Tax=Klebsormidium nitens TaxID=105231 RepID=A0A1Y1IJW3_KLENI|nr:hypothetical protein KFL_004700090 [Klebsormidium nitens]|eukprot:GAQ88927.1 hypothetical protein KFL_004700090 [Klebsormidium nitens]
MGEWVIGACINFVGSIGINFGTNLLKLGHNQREKLARQEAIARGEKSVEKKPITHFREWQVGVVIFAVGNALNFISFGYAAQSLLAALGSVQFISNVGFAYFVLGENVTNRIVVATALIVVGNIFLVAFGNHESTTYGHDDLLHMYENPVYLVYCTVLVLLVGGLYCVYRYGLSVVSSRKFSDPTIPHQWRTLVPFSYAMVSGVIGTQSVLFAKSLSVLMRLTMHGDSQLDGWFTYAVAILFALTAAFWMARLNQGLAMFDAMLIVPMLQIVWTFFSIFTGFIYFKEYQVFDGFQAGMFSIGIFFLFCGMYLLAPKPNKVAAAVVDEEELETLPLVADRQKPGLSPAPSANWDTEVQKASVQPGLGASSVHKRLSFGAAVGNTLDEVSSGVRSAYDVSMGMGPESVHTGTIFTMPMIASSRVSWRRGAGSGDEWAPGEAHPDFDDEFELPLSIESEPSECSLR